MQDRKRIAIVVLLLAVLALPAFAKPLEVTLLCGPYSPKWPDGYTDTGGFASIEQKLIAAYEAETGNKVKVMTLDLSTGSTMSIDALVAAGTPPNLYADFAGRVAKYMVPQFALDLRGYVKDLDDIIPSVRELVTKNGAVYALPGTTWGVAMCVNDTILEEAGYKLPKDWTIDEFLKAATLIKAKVPGKYATFLFAENQSSDQWWMPWFYAFGARVYAPGDYSKTVINTPKGLAAVRFFKLLEDKGYAPPGAAGLDDDDALAAWGMGKVAFLGMQVGHTAAMQSAVDQKLLDKPFKFHFAAFPHAKGEKPTPAAAGPTLYLVHKDKNDAMNKAAARLAWYMSGPEYQKVVALGGVGYPTRKSITATSGNPRDEEIAAVMAKNGVCDFGIVTQTFSGVRAQMFPLLAEMYTGKLAPEAVLPKYEKAVNDILSGK